MGSTASRELITIDSNNNPIINGSYDLNVSVGSSDHALYFQSLRPTSTVTAFDIPNWFNDFMVENAIRQEGYRTNPLNQGGMAPKIVDPYTPGLSYELPRPWPRWLQENAIPGSGRIIK